MKKKVALVLLLSLMTVIMAPTAVFATDYVEFQDNQQFSVIQPRLTYIAEAQTSIRVENGAAVVDCWVKGDYGEATKAKVIAELQLKSGNNWMAYGTWTNTENAFKASVYETKSVTDGHTYRVKATYTVWEGSQSETITVFSDEVTA